MIKKFTKEIKITPAFDRRSKDPSKDYGIHGCEMIFVLSGKSGAVQFVIFTNWYLPHVQEELLNKPIKDKIDLDVRFIPMPADVGYHSLKPTYEGQEICSNKCKHLGGKPCYYGGSALAADEVYKILVEKGSDGVWEHLEKYYNKIFKQ